MKFLLYSSPYQYYADNLIPLAKYIKSKKHDVYATYALSENGKEISMIDENEVSYSNLFLNGKIKVDAAVLVQPWWYQDNKIANHCKKHKIPFYIVDHAPPMMRYTQRDGVRSHLYRKDLQGAKAFFSYGQATVDVMRDVGCNNLLPIVGSSRMEQVINKIENKKKGYVLFDTSNKMEDKKLVKKFITFVDSHPNDQFIIREHSRSPQHFRKALKFANVKLDNESKEEELFQYTEFIFSFPSSAMLIPAILNKKMYSLYNEHFCKEAVEYYKKYQDCLPDLNSENNEPDFKKFISKNILYNKTLTEERIYNYILEDLK